jgi:hypothetical protein
VDRLVTYASLAHRSPREYAVDFRHGARLADGREMLLLDDRGLSFLFGFSADSQEELDEILRRAESIQDALSYVHDRAELESMARACVWASPRLELGGGRARAQHLACGGAACRGCRDQRRRCRRTAARRCARRRAPRGDRATVIAAGSRLASGPSQRRSLPGLHRGHRDCRFPCRTPHLRRHLRADLPALLDDGGLVDRRGARTEPPGRDGGVTAGTEVPWTT